jgi:hypothetical protein
MLQPEPYPLSCPKLAKLEVLKMQADALTALGQKIGFIVLLKLLGSRMVQTLLVL